MDTPGLCFMRHRLVSSRCSMHDAGDAVKGGRLASGYFDAEAPVVRSEALCNRPPAPWAVRAVMTEDDASQ